MAADKRQDLAYQIEEYMDAHSAEDVLGILIDICYGKAEHLRVNWQDEAAAREWEKAAKVIERAASRIMV